MMSAIVLALAMAAAAPAPNIGPAIAGKPNCYAVNDRYAGCAVYDASGELLRIKVEPRESLEQFNREQALSPAEYLNVMTKIGHAFDIGEYHRDDRPQCSHEAVSAGGRADLLTIPCRELSLRPAYVTIDDVDYLVAPRDQRKFTAGETIEIPATDLKD